MSIKIITENKKAWFDYEIIEKFEAGLVLQGSEVKSLRDAKVQLKDAYVAFRGKEAYLQNAHYRRLYGLQLQQPRARASAQIAAQHA